LPRKAEDGAIIRLVASDHALTGEDSFRAFRIYRREAGKWVEIARSHQGPHVISPNLAVAIMQLSNKLSLRGNYRGYSYREDLAADCMAHLLAVCLKVDETKGLNAFAYLTACAMNSFARGLDREKRHRDLRDQLLIDAGFDPSLGSQVRNSN
jgi:hypothetical protein